MPGDFFAPEATPEALASQKQLTEKHAALQSLRADRARARSQQIVGMLTEKYGMPIEQAQSIAADLATPQQPISGGLDAKTIRQEADQYNKDALTKRAEEEAGRLKQMTLRAKAFKDIHERLKAGEEVSPADRAFYDEMVAPHREAIAAAGRNSLATAQRNSPVAQAGPVVGSALGAIPSSLAGLAASIYGPVGGAVGAVPKEAMRQDMLAGHELASQERTRAKVLMDQAKLARGEPAETFLPPGADRPVTAGFVPTLVGEGAAQGLGSLADLANSVYGK